MKVIFSILSQPRNTGESTEPTQFRPAGTVSSFRLVQPLNAEFPIVETEFGMVIEVINAQFSNAPFPILLRSLPSSTDVSAIQPLKT